MATVAYGMGIDKPNVRHVVHWGTPQTLEAYHQQVWVSVSAQLFSIVLAWHLVSRFRKVVGSEGF